MSSTFRVGMFTLSSMGTEKQAAARRIEFRRRLGHRIRRAREARGWTQLQLANAMPGQVYSSQISVWERGRAMPNPEHLHDLADALEIPVEALFTD